MIPVTKLDSEFLFEKVTNIDNLINHLNGKKTASEIILDNSCITQAFFKRFVTVRNKPWITKDVSTNFLIMSIYLKAFIIIGELKLISIILYSERNDRKIGNCGSIFDH